jgi:hypothetical protein
VVHSFQDITNEGMRYFQKLYKEKDGCPIKEILDVLNVFSPVIIEDMNKSLEEEVLEAEVLGALSSMQKGKIRPGWAHGRILRGFLQRDKR